MRKEMKNVRRMLVILAIIASLGISILTATAQDKSDHAKKEKTFMRVKLGHIQKVLEGLLTEDFELIIVNSQKISLLTRAFGWQMLESTEYAERSADFRRSVDQLTKEAEKKDIDAAALAYMDVTMKCFQCHKYVRKMRHTYLDQKPGFQIHNGKSG
jgi:cytochrome c556